MNISIKHIFTGNRELESPTALLIRLFLIGILLLSFSGCTADLNFEEPQPKGDRNESNFRNRYTGSYLDLQDSSILTIDEHQLVQRWYFNVRVPVMELDSVEGLYIENGLLFYKDAEHPLPVEIINDTAVVDWKQKKDLFSISDDNLLRYYKGAYFLNTRLPDGLWHVRVLKLDRKGELTINSISGGEAQVEEIRKMTDVKEVGDDETQAVRYVIRPTRRELKEILKADLVELDGRYQKIK